MKPIFGIKIIYVLVLIIGINIMPSINGAFNESSNKEIIRDIDFSPQQLSVTITHPENAVYFNNQRLFPFFVPLILHGETYILAEIETTVEIERVEFWINGVLQFVDDAEPFDGFYPFEGKSFSRTEIMIKVYSVEDVFDNDVLSIYRIF